MIRCLCLCNCICILCQGMYMLKVLHSGVDPACCYWTRSHHTLQAFCPISPPACQPPIIISWPNPTMGPVSTSRRCQTYPSSQLPHLFLFSPPSFLQPLADPIKDPTEVSVLGLGGAAPQFSTLAPSLLSSLGSHLPPTFLGLFIVLFVFCIPEHKKSGCRLKM